MEIELLISKLDINKSTGPNGIPTKILLLIKSILSEPLSKIYNNSILTGQYVEKLNFLKLFQSLRKDQEYLSQTIDQFLFYRILTKLCKSWFSIVSMNSLRNLIVFMRINMGLELNIPQCMP